MCEDNVCDKNERTMNNGCVSFRAVGCPDPESSVMTLKVSLDLRGFAKFSMLRRLLMMAGKSFAEYENSSSRRTGRRWQDDFT